MPRTTVSIALLAALLWPASARADSTIGSIRFELDAAKHTAAAVQQQKHFRQTLRCEVLPIRGPKLAMVRRAIKHANRIIRDRAFRRRVRRWNQWIGTNDSSPAILRKLLHNKLTVDVAVIRRSKKHPCKTHFANGHTNAFVPDVRSGQPSKSRLLLLADQYLDDQYFSPEPQKAIRSLARTLLHEALHVVGYSHVGEIAFSARYNNTVPVYLGCLIMNWGAVKDWAGRNCHHATGLRPSRSPYRWLCYANHSLRRHLGKTMKATQTPHPITGAARLHQVNLLRVHQDNTVSVRWRNGGQIKRISKCRLVM